ncbi:MAG: lipid-A-disaccharide synthase [Rhodobacteraceae bacterium]|nr:lipid-A-disaccharide synthase [Paracoccaceae bacterium]
MSRALDVFLVAGEPSGDRLGGALMAGLKSQTDVSFRGVGGPNMAAQGLNSLFAMADLSVMGLLEVLPRVPRLLRRIRETVTAAVAARPDVLITIDSPDFCLRVASGLRRVMPDLKVVHYVAPSVWAWRPERAEKMARYVDHVLALLPFEPPYMEAAGMSCDFVGHPLVAEPVPTAADVAALRKDLRIGAAPVVLLLPGSRVGEIRRLLPIYEEVTKRVAAVHRDLRFCVPLADGVADDLSGRLSMWAVPVVVLNPQGRPLEEAAHRKRTVFRMAAAALATSGTVVLELAAADCPQVTAYRANWATTRLVRKMARIDTANLLNIVTDTRVIPEFLFGKCTAETITPALLGVLSDPGAQKAAAAGTMKALGLGGEDPGVRAAKSVLGFLGRGGAHPISVGNPPS